MRLIELTDNGVEYVKNLNENIKGLVSFGIHLNFLKDGELEEYIEIEGDMYHLMEKLDNQFEIDLDECNALLKAHDVYEKDHNISEYYIEMKENLLALIPHLEKDNNETE